MELYRYQVRKYPRAKSVVWRCMPETAKNPWSRAWSLNQTETQPRLQPRIRKEAAVPEAVGHEHPENHTAAGEAGRRAEDAVRVLNHITIGQSGRRTSR